LEIRFVEDKGCYNKIIQALKEFSNSIIITAEDDIIYPKDWIKKLYHSYITNPQDIHLNSALEVNIKASDFASFAEWKTVKKESAEFKNFILTEGGALFPPKCFAKEVLREDIYKTKSPESVDIWLWFMALVSNRRIRVVKNHVTTFVCTNFIRKLLNNNSKKYIQSNDEQINNLIEFYRQNIFQRLK
jgi:hypothetical protein